MNPIGAVIIAIFAVIWVVAGTHQLSLRWFVALVALALLISGVVIFSAVHVPFKTTGGGFDGRTYGIVVAFEAVAIVLAVVILKRAGRQDFLIPVIALIVGAHFFGMVPALHSNEFWWVGGVMCLLPLVVILFLPRTLWPPAVGLGCAAILWFSAIRAFW